MIAVRGLAALAIAAVLGATLSGCGSTASSLQPSCKPYASGVVLVVGTHANEPAPDLTTKIVCRLTQTIAAGMPIGAVAVDGRPSVLLAAQRAPIVGDNAAARNNGIVRALASIVATVQGARPDDDGSDLLQGLILAAQVASSAETRIHDVVVVDSGVTDSGLDLTVPGGTLVDPTEVAQHLLATHALDSDQFAHLTIEFDGLAETRAPQDDLSLRQKDAISALWPGIVRAAGGSASAVSFPRSGKAVSTGYTVRTAAVLVPDPFVPRAGEVLTFDGATDLAFVADQARFVDEDGARSLLTPIATWLAADRTRSADVIGRTSSADPTRNLALSTARAELCARLLIDAGAAPNQVHPVGAGYTADPPDTLPDGSRDPVASALNRVVQIGLH